MDKILINLFVPCIGEHFDVFIPSVLTVKEISSILGKMLEEISNQRYVSSGGELLCSLDQNILFDQSGTLGDYNVRNGEHLLFA